MPLNKTILFTDPKYSAYSPFTNFFFFFIFVNLFFIFFFTKFKIGHFQIHKDMDLCHILTAPINTHKMANNAPTIEKRKNLPFLLPLLLVMRDEELILETVVLFIFNLLLLKLGIRSKDSLTSAADAGVVGIDSTKAQKTEETRLAELSSPTSFSFASPTKFEESHNTPIYIAIILATNSGVRTLDL